MKLKPASKPGQRLILVSSALPQAWTRSRRSRSPPSPRPAVSSRQWPVRWHRVCQGRLSPSCSRQPRWRWGSTSCRCGRSPRTANTPCPPTASPAAPTVGLGLLTSSWLPLLPQLSSQGCKAAKRSVVSSWLSVYQVISMCPSQRYCESSASRAVNQWEVSFCPPLLPFLGEKPLSEKPCPSFALGYAVISTETLYLLRLLVQSVSDSCEEPVFTSFLLTNSLCLQHAK